MAEAQIGGQETGTLTRINQDEDEIQLVSHHSERPPVGRINSAGNTQVGEGNTQVITGSTTHNTYTTTNYHFHIENYYQHGNEPFSLDKTFQLKTADPRLALAGPDMERSSEERNPSSCEYFSNLNGIECPECGHYISAGSTTSKEMSPGKWRSCPYGRSTKETNESDYSCVEFYNQRRRWRSGRRWIVKENEDGSRYISSVTSWF